MPIVVRLQDDIFQFNCHLFSIRGSGDHVLAVMCAIGMDLDDALDLLADPATAETTIAQEIDDIL